MFLSWHLTRNRQDPGHCLITCIIFCFISYDKNNINSLLEKRKGSILVNLCMSFMPSKLAFDYNACKCWYCQTCFKYSVFFPKHLTFIVKYLRSVCVYCNQMNYKHVNTFQLKCVTCWCILTYGTNNKGNITITLVLICTVEL